MTTSPIDPTRAAHAGAASRPARGSARGSARRPLLLLLSLLLILAQLLTACGNDDAPAQGAADPGAAAAPAEESAAQPAGSQSAEAQPAADALALASTAIDAAAEGGAVEAAVEGATEFAAPAEDASAEAALLAASAASATSADDSRPLDSTTNVLVLGSDRRPNTPNWRTDVMMIVALDYANNRAGVISIPRDIFIDVIPGHNPNKINTVDYLGEQDEEGGGGPKLLASIIQEKMGIPIHHWVRFDFTGFVELVDALGGVEVEIDCPYYDYFQIENVILNVKPGIERLSGDEALVYVRSRKIGGDLDRARRQQRFIWAMRTQVLDENILPKLPALYNAVSDTVQTDMGVVQTLKVARFVIGLEREDITGFVIGYPLVEQGYAGNMWVFLADWEAIQAEAQLVFTRDPFLATNTLAECP